MYKIKVKGKKESEKKKKLTEEKDINVSNYKNK